MIAEPSALPHISGPTQVFLLLSFPPLAQTLFSARNREKGRITLTNPYRDVISLFYHSVFTHPPIPPRRSVWKARVNVPWQVPAWGWLNDCIQRLNGQLCIPQEFHHLSESASALCVLGFQASRRLPCNLQSGGILWAEASVVRATWVMACALFCRVSLTCRSSQQIPHWSVGFT